MTLRLSRRRGMTLVELLVALSLAALLMAGVLSVLRCTRQSLLIAQELRTPMWQESALNRLHRDLMTSHSINTASGWIWLEGDFIDFRNTEVRIDRVGYKCVPWMDGTSALMRRTSQTGDPVAIGPARLVIERLDSSQVPQPLSGTASPMPASVRVWIWEKDLDSPAIERDLVIY